MSNDDMAVATFKVPQNIRDQAMENAGDSEIADAVRHVHEAFAHDEVHPGHELDAAERAVLSSLQDRIDEQEQALADLRDQTVERIDTLEHERERRVEQQETYEEVMDDLGTRVHEGEHIFEDHAAIGEAAALTTKDESEVLADLKQRNPDVPAHRFEPAYKR